MIRRPPGSPPFPYTTLFLSDALVAPADEVYGEEGPHVHQRVGGGVDQNRLDRGGERIPAQRRERRQDVPRVGYRAVGEHPTHVALPEGEEVAHEHRNYGQRRDRKSVV